MLLINGENDYKEDPVTDQEYIDLCHFGHFVGTVSQLRENVVYDGAEGANCS